MTSGFSLDQNWGFNKLHLTFLLTVRRTGGTVAAFSFPVAAAPLGWTPAAIQWGDNFITLWTSSFTSFIRGGILPTQIDALRSVRIPAPPALWLCVGELALWSPAFAPRPSSRPSVSPPPAGRRPAASPDSHTGRATAPSRPAESTQKHAGTVVQTRAQKAHRTANLSAVCVENL